jgi:hypothetical protein
MPKEEKKTFVNLKYEGYDARINISHMSDLSELQERTKAAYDQLIAVGFSKIRFSKNDDNKLIKTWSELTCLAPEFNLELSGHWLNVVVILSPIPAIESFNLTGIR